VVSSHRPAFTWSGFAPSLFAPRPDVGTAHGGRGYRRPCVVCLDSGAPGPAANTWIAGGFARIRVDVPLTPTLYANQQGGFRVFCPSCTDNVVPVFAPVLAAFRVSGVARLTCPHCTVSTPIAELTFTPSAAVGQAALVIADAADGQLQDGVLQDLEERFGPVAIVAARVSAR
jgi:hypothetical protein